MRTIRFILLLLIPLLTLGVFYWALFTPKEDISRRIHDTLKEQEKRADLLFKKVTVEEVSSGIKYWQLAAETGTVNKAAGLASLQNAEGTFFKKGEAVLNFSSPAALWDMRKKEIYLDKPLGYEIIKGKPISLPKPLPNRKEKLSVFNFPSHPSKKESGGPIGYWFKANNLNWKLTDQKLTCAGGILLNKGEIAGYAEKLVGDVGLEKVELSGSPRIVLNTPSAPVTLESKTFELLNSRHIFSAEEDLKVFWRDAVISARAARYFQAEKKLRLEGGVNILYKDISARGNTADYLTGEQKIILSGEARAEQGRNKLNGNKVMLSLKDKKISLLGKGKVVIEEEGKKE